MDNKTSTESFAMEGGVLGPSRSMVEQFLSIITMALMILLSISGNILVLVAIARESVLHNKTSIFIANLAIADLVNAILIMSTILISCVYNQWLLGDHFCGIIGAFLIIACTASINTLGAIAIDRYFAIVHPFKYSERMSNRCIGVLLVWIWAQSLFFGMMPVYGWSEFVYIDTEYLCSADWSSHKSFTITIVTVNMSVPIALMTYCYAHIFRIASEHRKQINAQQKNKDENLSDENRSAIVALTKRAKQMRKDTKAAATLLIVMGTFLICWIPHTITMLCFAFTSCTAIPRGFYVASTWLAMLNSACNPFIYCTSNKLFRGAFKRTIAQIVPESCKRRRHRRVEPGTFATIDVGHFNSAHVSGPIQNNDKP